MKKLYDTNKKMEENTYLYPITENIPQRKLRGMKKIQKGIYIINGKKVLK
jgi:hypothetical protein